MTKPQKYQNQKQTAKEASRVQIQQTSFYSGKLPPPEMMEKYNLIEPTFASRILTMAEEEQKHIHKINSRQLTISVIMTIFGTITGLIALATLCYTLYQAIEKENTKISLAIIGIIITVVGIFVFKRKDK